ncbi:MAG: ABC transporter permease subunit [Candidatus Omnitrophica bacterium]|nr:ABC transporter permease subunit [Candidatus Omnitrophota bacterium]MBU1996096.1 ABC transporter permease subunit [Candidatus Omnitrophota bacterium]MBU4333828.1 ABC transporter permease subunit [Candidatus Omnitrophota bacterium]
MIGKPLKPVTRILVMILSVIVVLGAYTHLSHRQHIKNPKDKTIPTWSQLKDGLLKICEKNKRSGERWIVQDSFASAKRLSLGLLWGVVGAIIVGIAIGCFPIMDASLSSLLAILAKLPPTAALALFFVMLGTGIGMYVGIIVVGILPVLAQSIYLSIKDVPKELIYKATTLGASKAEIVWNVIVVHILPNIINSIRLQIGPSLVYLIAAEYACAHIGFGYRLRLQARLVNMDVVYPYLAILIIFGFIMDWLLKSLQRKLCMWYLQERE